MAYLLIANSDQSKYASLENGLESQYSTKNDKYPKGLILSADIIKNNWNGDSGKRNTAHKTSKHKNTRKK